jgi:hypothetical protein
MKLNNNLQFEFFYFILKKKKEKRKFKGKQKETTISRKPQLGTYFLAKQCLASKNREKFPNADKEWKKGANSWRYIYKYHIGSIIALNYDVQITIYRVQRNNTISA